jgi:ribosomal protein L11 methyltransferase
VIRLAVRVRRDHAEIVLAELLELAPSGVEEADLEGELVEFAVYGSPGELPEMPDLQAAAGGALVEVSSSEVGEDWDERWKRFHRPVSIVSPAQGRVPGIHVRPPWEPPSGLTDVAEIVIDPGRAFGTGGHATTRLCLELLLELTADRSPGPGVSGVSGVLGVPSAVGALLDIGTGSGVLAIAASMLGYRPVSALDNDPLSVSAASENAKVNGVKVDTRLFDLRREALPGVCSPVMLANLLKPLLLDLVTAIERSPEDPPEHLIAGGLLREEADEVVRAFAGSVGLRERARRQSGEWAAIWLQAHA